MCSVLEKVVMSFKSLKSAKIGNFSAKVSKSQQKAVLGLKIAVE